MNKLFLAFIFAFVHGCGSVGIAQTTPNTQTYFQNLPTPVNLIKNPDARLNALDVQKTGTVVVTATAATGNDPSYFSIGAISTLGYAEFDLRPVKSDMTSGQCEFKGKYFGTEASKYSARIFNGTTEVIKVVLKNTTSDLPNGGPWKEFSVGAPCSSNPKVRIYADAVGLSLNVNRLYYDKATNIGSYQAPNSFGFRVSSTCSSSPCTITSQFGGNLFSSVTRSATGTYTANFATTLKSIPACFAQIGSNSAHLVPLNGTSTSLVNIIGLTSAAGTAVDTDFNVVCFKTGEDEPQTVVRPETPRVPNIVRYTSGSGTYTPTPGTKYIIVEMVGGGQGGYGSGTSPGTPGNGTSTTFGTILTAAASGGANTINSPAEVQRNILGSLGGPRTEVQGSNGGSGGSSFFTGAGFGASLNNVGGSAIANTGSGGGGAGGYASGPGASGGTAGSYLSAKITNPVSTPYSVGTGGTGATAGTSGAAGGNGAPGVIIITEHFSNDVNAIIAYSVKTQSPQVVTKQSALIECSATSSVVASIGSWATVSNISGNRCNITMSGFTQNPICTAVVNSVETTNSRTVHLNVTSPTSMSIGCVNQLGGATSACTNSQFYLDCSGF